MAPLKKRGNRQALESPPIVPLVPVVPVYDNRPSILRRLFPDGPGFFLTAPYSVGVLR